MRFVTSLLHATVVRLVIAGMACALGLVVASAAGAPWDADQRDLTKRERPKHPTLEWVDGGPGYYGRFSNALPSRPTYFPIAGS